MSNSQQYRYATLDPSTQTSSQHHFMGGFSQSPMTGGGMASACTTTPAAPPQPELHPGALSSFIPGGNPPVNAHGYPSVY
jgi:hypothetical protein